MQRCLPSDGFPEQHHGLDTREELVEGAGRGPPPLVIHAVQGGEPAAELVHRGHVPEAQALGDKLNRPLTRHQHVLVVVLREHLQRGVGHDHLLLRHGHIQPVGQLVRLLLPQRIPGVCHEDGGHAPRAAPVVIQLLEGLGRARQHVLAAHDHSVDIEHEAEIWVGALRGHGCFATSLARVGPPKNIFLKYHMFNFYLENSIVYVLNSLTSEFPRTTEDIFTTFSLFSFYYVMHIYLICRSNFIKYM